MRKTKGEITRWRLLPTNQIDKAEYSSIIKGFVDFISNPKSTEYDIPSGSIMLEGIIPIDEEYGDCIMTSWLKKIEKGDDEMFYAETKSGSIYAFSLTQKDWLMVFTFGEIRQYGSLDIWFPNETRFNFA